ncbi:MAG: hypothetical protein Q9169_003142, partial [Polycauliona sp. 2 TL-2023]
LTRDDIYIMVEDEFVATAQLFTSHLHHAEYVRLKNAAKARNSSNLNTTTNGISRPTDSITAMRAETKKKKEAEVRTGKNTVALDKMKSDARDNLPLTSDDDDNLDSEDEADEQPWAGTSLQGLMAPVARKNLTSLSGLQKIQSSSTRAAKGYPKPEDTSQSNNYTQNRTIPPLIRPAPPPPSRTHLPPHPSTPKDHRPTLRRLSDMSSSGDESSDDLDALSTHAPRTSYTKTQPPSYPPIPIPKPSNPLSLAASDLFHPTSSQKRYQAPDPTPIQNQKHRSTDSSPPRRNNEVAAARKRLEERRQRAAAAVKKKDENTNGDVNVDEIPIFLV